MHAKTKKELTKMNFFESPHRSSDKYLKDIVNQSNFHCLQLYREVKEFYLTTITNSIFAFKTSRAIFLKFPQKVFYSLILRDENAQIN